MGSYLELLYDCSKVLSAGSARELVATWNLLVAPYVDGLSRLRKLEHF